MPQLNAFNCRTTAEKMDIVRGRGVFLSARHERGCGVVLYHLGGFFAEVWHDEQDDGVVLVRGFEGPQLLEPYLGEISLQGLMG